MKENRMAAPLTFYTNPMSRGRVARWMLEEVGEPYETVVLDYGTTMKGEEYLAINPMGKVPAIKHGDAIVTETAAVCAYLADAFPEKQLSPPLSDRAAYYRWLFFTAGPYEAAVTNKALEVSFPDEKKGFVGYGSFEEAVATLEGALANGPYICGEQFTAADVYIGSQIGWGLMFKSIPERPAFVEYSKRLQSRPAAARARELDDALVPKDQGQ
jgi:glutathione S-transferase